MSEWCLQHPYLTTLILISLISAVTSVANRIIDLFKKPVPTTVNLNVDPADLMGGLEATGAKREDLN